MASKRPLSLVIAHEILDTFRVCPQDRAEQHELYRIVYGAEATYRDGPLSEVPNTQMYRIIESIYSRACETVQASHQLPELKPTGLEDIDDGTVRSWLKDIATSDLLSENEQTWTTDSRDQVLTEASRRNMSLEDLEERLDD